MRASSSRPALLRYIFSLPPRHPSPPSAGGGSPRLSAQTSLRARGRERVRTVRHKVEAQPPNLPGVHRCHFGSGHHRRFHLCVCVCLCECAYSSSLSEMISRPRRALVSTSTPRARSKQAARSKHRHYHKGLSGFVRVMSSPLPDVARSQYLVCVCACRRGSCRSSRSLH